MMLSANLSILAYVSHITNFYDRVRCIVSIVMLDSSTILLAWLSVNHDADVRVPTVPLTTILILHRLPYSLQK